MKYKIGDIVWCASRERVREEIVCPECLGKKYLTVIMGDGSQVTIACVGCSRGYEQPLGYVTYWKEVVSVRQKRIDGVEATEDKVEYKINLSGCCCNIIRENEVFDTEEEAKEQALKLMEEHNQKELARVNEKHKHNRTWSWNAHYHRDCIRRAERDLIYHKAKLDVAKIKAKENTTKPVEE
jgi:hypothetical protein